MPSQQLDKDHGCHGVEPNIHRRQASGNKERQGNYLDRVHDNCNQPGQPVLRILDRFQKVKNLHKTLSLGYTGATAGRK